MKLAGSLRTLIALGCIVVACKQAAALPPPPALPGTIWNRLGIPQGFNKIRDANTNKRGLHPGKERLPPLKAIADPANMLSPNPAIATAAKVKAEEDLAPQKIKAVKYLATIGCGCYPDVKDALVAALEDCTEEVRYQAALAIEDATNLHCAKCNQSCCCDEKLTEKLSKVANERDEKDCFVEVSERVREAAKRAMCECCSKEAPAAATESQPTPPVPPSPEPEGAPTEAAPSPDAVEENSSAGGDGGAGLLGLDHDGGEGRVSRVKYTSSDSAATRAAAAEGVSSNGGRADQRPRPTFKGKVARVSRSSDTVEVRIDRFSTLNVGDRLKVLHRYLLDVVPVGYVEVVATGLDGVTAQPIEGLKLNKIARGDDVLFEPGRVLASRPAHGSKVSEPPRGRDVEPQPTEATTVQSIYALELNRGTQEADPIPEPPEMSTAVSPSSSPETPDDPMPLKANLRR